MHRFHHVEEYLDVDHEKYEHLFHPLHQQGQMKPVNGQQRPPDYLLVIGKKMVIGIFRDFIFPCDKNRKKNDPVFVAWVYSILLMTLN